MSTRRIRLRRISFSKAPAYSARSAVERLSQAASAARAKRYAKCAPPATTAVQVSALFFPAAMIEIQATAVLP